MYRKVSFLSVCFFMISLSGFSQNEEVKLQSKKEIRKERPAFYNYGIGVTKFSCRDFATSPLTYAGDGSSFNISGANIDARRDFSYGLNIGFGSLTNNSPSATASSSLFTASLYYSSLYQLNVFSNERLNLKVGGLVDVPLFFRKNSDLQNNGNGYEIIPTLFGSAQIAWDFSRTKDVSKKFLWIKYQKKERTRELSFRVNVGIMNNSVRNGFAYIGQSGVLNEFKLFDGYSFNAFSGFRMGTTLDYTLGLINGSKNKIRFTYAWDALKTAGSYEPLEIASHTLKFALMFNTNNK
jgi:hypothetical protein